MEKRSLSASTSDPAPPSIASLKKKMKKKKNWVLSGCSIQEDLLIEKRPNPLSIPQEMLIEILSRLPVKSLLKFRCVSKSWHSLMRDHQIQREKLPPAMLGLFIKKRIDGFAGLGSRTYIDSCSVDTALSFIPSSSPSDICIADSCNGLLLFQDLKYTPPVVYVCNPATRKWTQPPKPPHQCPLMSKLALAFDPGNRRRRRPHYKIISVISDEAPLVFSSITGEWTELPQPTVSHSFMKHYYPDFTFVNGVLYAVTVIRPRVLVLAIDLERDICTWIPSSDDMNSRTQSSFPTHCIGNSGGLLHIAITSSYYLYVYVLLDDGNRFSLKHKSTDLRDVLKNLTGTSWSYSIVHLQAIAFHSDLDLIFLKTQNLIILYHMASGKVEEFSNDRGRSPYLCSPAYTPCYSDDLDFLK